MAKKQKNNFSAAKDSAGGDSSSEAGNKEPPRSRSRGRSWWIGGGALAAALVAGLLFFDVFGLHDKSNGQAPIRNLVRRRSIINTILRDTGELTTARRRKLQSARSLPDLERAYAEIRQEQLKGVPIDGARAFSYLKQLVAFGPRPTGSDAMRKQYEWLVKHFRQLGGKVTTQKFQMRHPETGQPVDVRNIIVEWHPERKQRVLLCAHYDTRPFPDEERNPSRRRGRFVGANDGAGGTALLCELGHHMKKVKGKVGVDFVLFDAEELVYVNDRDKYFIGSKHFARDYRNNPPTHTYRKGVLLDMIADAQLQILQEENSVRYAPNVVRELWSVAGQLGIREFKRGKGHNVRDDHLPLNEIARIPTCDLIDFDYPHPSTLRRTQYWHTQDDTPDKCSDVSLARVGWVVLTWLQQQ